MTWYNKPWYNGGTSTCPPQITLWFRRPVWLYCPRCGARIEPEWNYCPYCGYRLR